MSIDAWAIETASAQTSTDDAHPAPVVYATEYG
jgi:hypothetical protein